MFQDHDMAELSTLDPAGPSDARPSADSPAADELLARLLREIDSASASTTPRRRTMRPRFMAIAAAGGAIALSAGAALIAGSGDRAPLAPSSASAAFLELADAASDNPGLGIVGPDQFYYERLYVDAFADADGKPYVTQSSDIVIERGAIKQWISPDGDTWVARLDDPLRHTMSDYSFGYLYPNKPLTYDELVSLPTDPDALQAELEQGIVHAEQAGRLDRSPDQALMGEVLQLIQQPAPSDLQVALLEVAARLPEATQVGELTTPQGDSVTSVAYQFKGGIRRELLFNPDTGQYVGWADTPIPGADLPIPQQRYFRLITDSAVVDHVGDEP
jgi:hypothetical protein